MGGHAVLDVVPIKQENVKETLEQLDKKVLSKLGIDKESYRVFGSTGKKKPGNTSGDIDLSVDVSDFQGQSIKEKILNLGNQVDNLMKTESAKNTGSGIVSLGFPIAVDQKGEKVQVDFMAVDPSMLDFSSWSFHSPNEWESKYKGLHRNILLMSIAYYVGKQLSGESIESIQDEKHGNVLVDIERMFFDLHLHQH